MASPQRPVVLDAQGLHREYGRGRGRTIAVDNVSLRVHEGEIVGIQGASGSGKSTLLRLLAGTEAPSSGTIRLCDQPMAPNARRLRARRGAIMPIFQDPVSSLDARWPLWRSITEPLMARHRDNRPNAKTRRTLSEAALATVGLEGLDLNARPSMISRGQCQRVALLRAVIAEPKIVLADEPTSALDVSVAAGVLRVLADVARGGAALVVVSHDLDALDVLCDRVVRMDRGRIANDDA